MSASTEVAVLPRPAAEGQDLERAAAELLSRLREGSPAVVGVAPVAPGDAATVPALALARLVSAHLGTDVLLLEADLRRPGTLARELGVPERPGLVDLLAHPQAAGGRIGHRAGPGLLAVGSGMDGTGRALLAARPLDAVLTAVRQQHPLTLLITPPQDGTGQGDVAVRLCDQVVLVAVVGVTARADVAAAYERLGSGRCAGAVLIRPTRSRITNRGRSR